MPASLASEPGFHLQPVPVIVFLLVVRERLRRASTARGPEGLKPLLVARIALRQCESRFTVREPLHGMNVSSYETKSIVNTNTV